MLDTTDIVILIIVCLGTLAYFTKGILWAKPQPAGYGYGTQYKPTANGTAKPKKTRNIVERMEQQNKNVVVFFGSQTGTAGIPHLSTRLEFSCPDLPVPVSLRTNFIA
jgi:NADPH-ferrihemoprotein reductase